MESRECPTYYSLFPVPYSLFNHLGHDGLKPAEEELHRDHHHDKAHQAHHHVVAGFAQHLKDARRAVQDDVGEQHYHRKGGNKNDLMGYGVGVLH